MQDQNTRPEQTSNSSLWMQSGICPFKGQRSNSLLVSPFKGQQPAKVAHWVWVTPQKTSRAPPAICNSARGPGPGVNPLTLSQGARIEFQNIAETLEMPDPGAPFQIAF